MRHYNSLKKWVLNDTLHWYIFWSLSLSTSCAWKCPSQWHVLVDPHVYLLDFWQFSHAFVGSSLNALFRSVTDRIWLCILLLLFLIFCDNGLWFCRLKLDRDEIWHGFSLSKCALIDGARFLISRHRTFQMAALMSTHARCCICSFWSMMHWYLLCKEVVIVIIYSLSNNISVFVCPEVEFTLMDLDVSTQ